MPEKKKRPNSGSAIGVGLALGAGVGLLMDNLPMGIAIGLALGVAFGGVSQVRQRDAGQRDGADDDDAGPGTGADDREIELDCDYNLRFEYVIDAITAVSGKVQQGEIVKLIDKIKFAPPRGAPQP